MGVLHAIKIISKNIEKLIQVKLSTCPTKIILKTIIMKKDIKKTKIMRIALFNKIIMKKKLLKEIIIRKLGFLKL